MSQNWDGNVINLQVTDAKERTIELRCEGARRSSISCKRRIRKRCRPSAPRSVLSPTARESATRRRNPPARAKKAPGAARSARRTLGDPELPLPKFCGYAA
jgi:hypothetical protein